MSKDDEINRIAAEAQRQARLMGGVFVLEQWKVEAFCPLAAIRNASETE